MVKQDLHITFDEFRKAFEAVNVAFAFVRNVMRNTTSSVALLQRLFDFRLLFFRTTRGWRGLWVPALFVKRLMVLESSLYKPSMKVASLQTALHYSTTYLSARSGLDESSFNALMKIMVFPCKTEQPSS